MSPQELAKQLRAARREKEISLISLADAVGVHSRTIANFEHTNFDVAFSTVEAIANALGYELTLTKREGK